MDWIGGWEGWWGGGRRRARRSSGSRPRRVGGSAEEDADAADEVFEHAFDGGDLGQEEGGRAC